MAYQSTHSATQSALVGSPARCATSFCDENIRLFTVIPGTVATPIRDKVGGAPEFALTPEESARGILKGVAANERTAFVTDDDREGAVNAFDPAASKGKDEYFLHNARARRSGKTAH